MYDGKLCLHSVQIDHMARGLRVRTTWRVVYSRDRYIGYNSRVTDKVLDKVVQIL